MKFIILLSLIFLAGCAQVEGESIKPLISNKECIELRHEMIVGGTIAQMQTSIDSYQTMEYQGVERTLTDSCKAIIKEWNVGTPN